MNESAPVSALDARISGSFAQRFAQELFRNSGQFPLANLLLELLLEGPRALAAPDLYALIGAALLQSWLLVRPGSETPLARFAGNLAGPAAYTAVEFSLEGFEFFGKPHHVAYWVFALALAGLQAARSRSPGAVRALLVIAENVVRAAILFTLYAIFEALSDPAPFSPGAFFADRAHVFIGLATLILGLSVGFASLAEESYLVLLKATSGELKRYSEWLLGADLLERVIKDPQALSLKRHERTLVFMDIRGFTAWSERCSPEAVVHALNGYYAASEDVLRRHGVIKLKFSADEVMAVFSHPVHAVACALEMRESTRSTLAPWGLAAGIGIHCGPVVEGLLGSPGVMGYDVIGDTVNTAKRIEGAAAGGEVIISEAVRAELESGVALGTPRTVLAKGKAEPLAVFPLA